MKLVKIVKSDKPTKRYTAVFKSRDGKYKRVSFGSPDHENYLIHKDDKRKEAYLRRHAGDLETGDPTRPGYLSYYITWNKKSLRASISDYRRRFNL